MANKDVVFSDAAGGQYVIKNVPYKDNGHAGEPSYPASVTAKLILLAGLMRNGEIPSEVDFAKVSEVKL